MGRASCSGVERAGLGSSSVNCLAGRGFVGMAGVELNSFLDCLSGAGRATSSSKVTGPSLEFSSCFGGTIGTTGMSASPGGTGIGSCRSSLGTLTEPSFVSSFPGMTAFGLGSCPSRGGITGADFGSSLETAGVDSS